MAVITGNNSNNTLTGTNDDDQIDGLDGADTLSGLGGNDVLIGGRQNDTLSGGAGNDIFAFRSPNFDSDTITDFTVGDRIDLSAFNVADLATLQRFIAQSGLNTEIRFFRGGSINSITIANVLPTALTDASFIFNTSLTNLNVSGGSSIDVLFGGNGNDQLFGLSDGDTLSGGSGDDYLVGGQGRDVLIGGAGNDIFAYIERGFTDDTIADFTQGDRIDLSAFNIPDFATLQRFITQSGQNTLISLAFSGQPETITINNVLPTALTASSFIFSSTATNLTVNGTSSNDFLFGANGNDQVIGSGGQDTLIAGNGDDFLVGGTGNDLLIGGAGNDIFAVTARGFDIDVLEDFTAGDRIDLNALNIADFATLQRFITQSGPSTIISFNFGGQLETIRINNTLPAALTASSFIFNASATGLIVVGTSSTDTLFGGNANDQIFAGGGNDTVSGGNGNDYLEGGTGNDLLIGGTGNDIFGFAARGIDGDIIADFTAGDRIDLTAFNIADLAPLQRFISQSGTNTVISLFFGGQAETITINNVLPAALTASSFIFNSAIADLTVNGTSSNDLLFGGNGNDTVNGGSGNDTLDGGSGNDFINGDSGTDTARGGNGDDTIFGGAANDSLFGDEGNDTLSGGTENDVLSGGGGDDALNGDDGNDVLVGGIGNDNLSGGTGSNEVYGGPGDDTYVLTVAGDAVIEAAGEGLDTVRTAVNAHTLRANVENLIFTGGATSFTGIGNAENNFMRGGAGSDQLSGLAGNDSLGDGGGAGIDTLIGGAGDDIYVIENRSSSTLELAGEGNDTVITSFAVYQLQANVENLTANDNGPHGALVGNTLGNAIRGGTGTDDLFGREGDDTLFGGTGAANSLFGQEGNDTYFVSAQGDSIFEVAGQGIDTVRTDRPTFVLSANVENLQYDGIARFTGIGNGEANRITGGGDNDFLSGLGGNDVLIGGAGNDELLGGTGADQFLYLNTATGNDRIFDFVSGTDKIAFFGPAFGSGPISLVQGSGALAATTANFTILHDQATGRLFYDTNGTGAGGLFQFAQVNAGLTLAAGDFIFV